MSDNKKTQSEDLKKLEDEAYYELCQIIAEAMQYQDVGLLDSRIAAWKNKYKKLLDNSPSNSNFKKRVEFLLTQYYSEITQYILKQLKLKEEKKVENQSKALRQLYSIIRDTNDLDLLKKKVKQWQDKYPVSGFLKMYQKRIEYYTREKNLRENAFEQEKAFEDLVDITKVHGTLDELKNELTLWEEKYSINNKYTIDDFIKHQSEVKRFTSDEFLQSIARDEKDDADKNDVVEEYNNKSCSALSLQTTAYSALLSIAGKSNNVSELFDWVYKNRYIKFNDKYKELILSATYLNYRPQYLNSLTIPDINISKSSLSFDEYKNIDEIKRYAIISYFNLLLPPGKSMANDYFNKHIQTIYSKSEKAKHSNVIEDTSTSLEEVIDSGIEISLEASTKNSNNYKMDIELQKEEQSDKKLVVTHTPVEKITDVSEEIVLDLSDTESALVIDLEEKDAQSDITNEIKVNEVDENLINEEPKTSVEKTDDDFNSIDIEEKTENTNQASVTIDLNNSDVETNEELDKEDKLYSEKVDFEKPVTYDTIVALSPLFFETINNYNKQSILVRHIYSTVNEYVESQTISLENEQVKTKYDLE